MIEWRTDKPTGSIILAKIAESFCYDKNRYAVLRFREYPYQHYSEDCDEIPYSAIEKWTLIE